MRRKLLIAMLLILVAGCAEWRQRVSHAISPPAPEPVGIKGKAVVLEDAEELGTSELSGVVFLVELGGAKYGAVCTGTLERTCSSLRANDPVKISGALVKYGSLTGETISYTGHYLEIESIQARR